MRVAFVVVVIAGVSFAKEPKPVRVSGVAEVTQPWCGGAMPPRGEAQRVLPHAKARFVVKPGKKNSVAPTAPAITTDDKGRFSISLTPGTWCVVPADRSDEPPSEVAKRPLPPGTARPMTATPPDFACLDHVWGECLATIEVGAQALTNVKLMTFESCGFTRPCEAPGPQPPSAPPSSAD
ncbi:MAG: hypothetical protein GQE15_13920 [Archangiaceae bacterium]|nr:hypothetical protein [Archangiaceae bacterium]